MSCLVLVVIILVIAVFWKLFLEFFWYLVLAMVCAAIPVCRETIPPFTYWYFENLVDNPLATILVTIAIAFMTFFAFDAFTSLLYKQFAPPRLTNNYPEFRDFKKAIKEAWRDS